MNSLRKLVCGRLPVHPGGAGHTDHLLQSVEGLGALVEDYGTFAKRFKNAPTEKLSSYFAPLAVRSMLEAACSILIARLDPMRVIYSARAQNSPSYDRGRQQNASVKWKGDIIPGDWMPQAPKIQPLQPAAAPAPVVPAPVAIAPVGAPAAAPAPGQAAAAAPAVAALAAPLRPQKNAATPIWDPKVDASKLPRAMLSGHFCEIVWTPSLQILTDWLTLNPTQSVWLTELTAISPEDVSHELPSIGQRLYSELSKGIHAEFIVQRQTIFDDVTLQRLIAESVSWISKIALLSHFSHASNLALSDRSAIKLFTKVEAEIL